MNASVEVSVVCPVYQAESILPELLRRLRKVLRGLGVPYEIILVDDRSKDDSWRVMQGMVKEYDHLRIFRLSRNFGQHNTITAGLSQAKGAWTVVMDCDLQDKPEEIPNLYEKALQSTADAVVARRTARQDRFTKRMSSTLYHIIFGYLTDTEQDPAVANFGIYSRKVIEAILSMKDQIRYFPAMLQWVGFERSYLNVEHGARTIGSSSYGMTALTRLALSNALSFSDKPLRLTVGFGFLVALSSMGIGLFYLVWYFLGKIDVLGFASLIISTSFFFGMTIMIIGIIGLYLGKVFEELKSRPVFIISESE